jgi:hypothetical protein
LDWILHGGKSVFPKMYFLETGRGKSSNFCPTLANNARILQGKLGAAEIHISDGHNQKNGQTVFSCLKYIPALEVAEGLLARRVGCS